MENRGVENQNIVVKDTGKYGKGLFASRGTKKGEVIADFSDGGIYEAENCLDLPKEVADHAVQFAEHKWIDTKGIGRYANHSCEPNCGIKDKFIVVAMRDIGKDEEVTWDYEMTEDSNWRMNCHCGSHSCRKIIGAYKNMPKSAKDKYRGFISQWLIEKYGE